MNTTPSRNTGRHRLGLGEKIRVLIVDDHPLVREGLIARLSTQADIEVCGQAASADEARSRAVETHPTLVIVDIELKNSDGLELIKRLRVMDDVPRILVVSAYDEALYAERALRAGAHGYINKQEVSETILDAIHTVLDGQRFISPRMAQRIADRALDSRNERQGIESLSNRELQVFSLIGAGLSTREIADQLHLSVHTIESHRERLRLKLNLKTGTELVRAAVQWALHQARQARTERDETT